MEENAVKKTLNRRTFIGTGTAGLAGAAITGSGNANARIVGANDRINIGFIGCGDRGHSIMRSMSKYMDTENFTFTALCDVWKLNLNKSAAFINEATGKKPRTFSRYNDLIELKDIDAVMIATSDHAHSTILITASDAGKDVFCEKPMAMNMEEARGAVDAVRRNKTVCQISTQRRSEGSFIAAARYIQEGNLGKISTVDLKWNDNSPRWLKKFDNVWREDVDWEGFLMHTQKYPFHPRRFRCWHLYRAYTTGPIGVLGAHLIDLVTWFMKAPYPKSAVAFGDRLVWKDREHFDTFIATYKYEDFLVSLEHRFGNSTRRSEAVFYGTQGILTSEIISNEGRVDPNRIEPTGEMYKTSPLALVEESGKPREITLEPDPSGMDHNLNWIRAMRDRKDPNTTVEDGYSHSVAAMMGLWAAEREKCLVYDPDKRDIF